MRTRTHAIRSAVQSAAKILLTVASMVALGASSNAAAITIGTPDTVGNCFPFGCVGFGSAPGTRYQQVYEADQFPDPIAINEIRFHLDDVRGPLVAGIFRISLATTPLGVNELTPNFDGNYSLDREFFSTTVLSGAIPVEPLSFSGAQFVYNPADGNLLLDIEISGISHPDGLGESGNGVFFESMRFNTDTFSRVSDFSPDPASEALSGRGLVTTFVPQPNTGILVALGLILLSGYSRRSGACSRTPHNNPLNQTRF